MPEFGLRGEGPPLLRVDGLGSGATAFSFSIRCSAKCVLKKMDMGHRLRLGNSVIVDGALANPCKVWGTDDHALVKNAQESNLLLILHARWQGRAIQNR